MTECKKELNEYLKCIQSHPKEITKTLWCRQVLKNLDSCMIERAKKPKVNFSGERMILKDIAFVN
jgi:hypothetical protein